MNQLANTLNPTSLADSDWSRPDNRFLPVRACDLVQTLAADAEFFGLTTEAITGFATALEQVIDHETGAFERRLSDVYALFNPDRDTLPMREPPLPRPDEYDQLAEQLAYVLDKANYEELDDVQIAQAVMQARSRNLSVRVDPDRVEFLRLWVRGRGVVPKRERNWWRPWHWNTTTVPIFKRLVVLARLKNDPYVMLKLFKDIPESDVEALLPHAEVKMTLLDRLKLFGTGVGTVGTTLSKIMGLLALWKLTGIILLGLGTLGVRSVLGYRNARLNRDWQRTRHLYFQNLGNNASALQALVATVKQEEFKETLLTYLFAQAPATTEKGAAELPIGERIERYVRQRYDLDVDFDITDGEHKLVKLGLCPAAATHLVLPVDEAIEVLRTLGQGPGVRMLELN